MTGSLRSRLNNSLHVSDGQIEPDPNCRIVIIIAGITGIGISAEHLSVI